MNIIALTNHIWSLRLIPNNSFPRDYPILRMAKIYPGARSLLQWAADTEGTLLYAYYFNRMFNRMVSRSWSRSFQGLGSMVLAKFLLTTQMEIYCKLTILFSVRNGDNNDFANIRGSGAYSPGQNSNSVLVSQDGGGDIKSRYKHSSAVMTNSRVRNCL